MTETLLRPGEDSGQVNRLRGAKREACILLGMHPMSGGYYWGFNGIPIICFDPDDSAVGTFRPYRNKEKTT